jgi:hypothetical protein
LAKLSDARRRTTPRELRRPGLAAAAVLVVLFQVFLAAAEPVDTLLARAGSRTIAASDVALARALGVLGFAPSASPIERSDVDRYVDALLMLEEAGRIGIEVEPAAIDAAWVAVGIRAGGEAALERWLRDNAIDRDWARRLVAEDLVKSKFLDARFSAFVFPDEEAITRELGPGQHDEAAREQARERLVRQAASENQATWLADARRRASIRILLPAGSSVAPPFVLP